MPVLYSKTSRSIIIAGAIITWFAVLLQFYLILANRQTSIAETILRFFGFFTILSNILVALCFSFLALQPKKGLGAFFTTPNALTAIAVYITVVGIIFNTVLRFLWNLDGMQFVVNELLHVVVPLYFLLFWIVMAPKNGLNWKDVFPWLWYPFIYAVFVLIRGALSGYYPYPFLDVIILGYEKVIIHCILLFFVFFLLSLFFVAMGRKLSSREKTQEKNII